MQLQLVEEGLHLDGLTGCSLYSFINALRKGRSAVLAGVN